MRRSLQARAHQQGVAAAKLACRCGRVRGTLLHAAPRAVNRVRCFCDDCQAFAHEIERTDIMDAQGGTDIIQVAPARLRFHEGHDCIAALRLSANGLYRYYTTCCRTPLGNTPGPSVPFIGVPAAVFRPDETQIDQLLGPVFGVVYGQYAVGDSRGLPRGVPLRMVMRATVKVITWLVCRQSWPHPFFDRATGRSLFFVRVLTADRRELLRQQCARER